ncbi:hypothetical protein [Streptomyces sp. NPDC091259]|uniref:hypothetical protein n=1 Tax=Streptomyces sp. NPDC091259 TaxID=3365976 RepID=UPI00381D80F4
MIRRVNGLFGSGRRTLADNLGKALPGSVLAAPEQSGGLLRHTLWGHRAALRDHQGYPTWRSLTVACVSEAVCAHRRRRAPNHITVAKAWMLADGQVIDTSTLTADEVLQSALTHLPSALPARSEGDRRPRQPPRTRPTRRPPLAPPHRHAGTRTHPLIPGTRRPQCR